MRNALLVLALGCLSQGCTLSNMTPQARFSESAHTLTEASRWGHVDMALPHVSAKYSESFLARHAAWCTGLSIADAELVRIQLGEDKATAMSEVAVSWYPSGQISLRQSVITQKWEREKGTYRLVDEVVRAGDPTVFAELPTEADKSSGG
jgi:hypothetical protein